MMARHMQYRLVATLAALLCLVLALSLTFFPDLPLALFGVEVSIGANFMSRRAAALFFGFFLMLFSSRKTKNTEIVTTMSRGFAVACILLATDGCVDFYRGIAGVGIFLAVFGELAFAAAFITAIKNHVGSGNGFKLQSQETENG
jgi:hypothetical protein